MGISTMAAAALGNTISDVAGVGLGGFIESMATKLGLPQSKLSRCVKKTWKLQLRIVSILDLHSDLDSKEGLHTAMVFTDVSNSGIVQDFLLG